MGSTMTNSCCVSEDEGLEYESCSLQCDRCQHLKQCPPKKRFKGCKRPRPVVVSQSSIALDRLVQVALSPTDPLTSSDLGNRTYDFASAEVQGVLPDMGAGAATPEDEGAASKVDGAERSEVPGFSLRVEAHKLKRFSSLSRLAQPRRRSPPAHEDSRRFTPRFKSLLDISC